MERLTERQEQFIQAAPPLYQGAVRDAFEGKASPRRAIKAFCLSCTGFVRDEVRNCTVVLCPLHAFRPYVKRDDDQGESAEEHWGGQGNDANDRPGTNARPLSIFR
mgnify:CR=1 FL=1